jgi:hypothetical protein
MTLRDMEGFDALAEGDLALKYAVTNRTMDGFPSGPNIVAGRIAGNAWRWANGGTSMAMIRQTYDNQATWIVGYAAKIDSINAANLAWWLFSLMDGGTSQVDVRCNGSQQFTVTRNGTLLGTASGFTFSLGTYNYLELKTTIHPTAGVVELWINGIRYLNLTGINTRATANSYANQLQIGFDSFSSNNPSITCDDIYLCDGTGSVNNGVLGDCRVQTNVPNGAGSNTAWTPSAGSNFQCVDEATQNGDTDYVSSANAGDTDTYAFADLSVTTSIVRGVKVNMWARKDDAGSRVIAGVTKSGATTSVGANLSLNTTYQDYTQLFETDPNTAAAWTVPNFNAAEFGQRVIS